MKEHEPRALPFVFSIRLEAKPADPRVPTAVVTREWTVHATEDAAKELGRAMALIGAMERSLALKLGLNFSRAILEWRRQFHLFGKEGTWPDTN